MFGPSAKLVLLLLFVSGPVAWAKKSTFDSGLPLGIAFQAGLSSGAKSDLVGEPQEASRNYSNFFAFEPFLDFTNFALRATGQIHQLPILSSATTTYGETSDSTAYLYGIQLILAPYVSESRTTRAYIKLGIAKGIAHTKNVRNMLNSSGQTTATYTEKAEGSSRELSAGAGIEFFLAQNYTMQLEGGFRRLEFSKFTYKAAGTNLSGTAVAQGDSLLTSSGGERKLDLTGGYASIGLALNF